MSKRTLFLIFALTIITFVLLVMALYEPSMPKTVQTVTAPKEPVAQTTLSFGSPFTASSSSVLRRPADLRYSLPINIATGTNKVTAVQLELQYDPKILTNVTVAPGLFFTNPDVLLNQIDAKTGRVSYALGVGLAGRGVAGRDAVAMLSFEVKSETPQPTSIFFLPKTLVTAEGISESVLEQTNIVGQFTLGEDNSTPSAQ
jgi:hypothetical protein